MNKQQSWKIHKFGGTSLLNADRFRQVHRILTQKDPAFVDSGPKAIVVSAMKGVTDDLLRTVELARKQDASYKELLEKIIFRHQEAISSLLSGPKKSELLAMLSQSQHELGEILRGVWLLRLATVEVLELVSGTGEVWSAQILNAFLCEQGQDSQWLDARQVLVVETINQQVIVDWGLSQAKTKDWRQSHPTEWVVITGFVASHKSGRVTTLGRNGSDYSGSIFGVLFDCDEIFIWTDVDGVLSADPRLVPEAVILDELSYSEVTELAYFGAKVVHPSTMVPAIDKKIPIWIKNTLNPHVLGTKIHARARSDRAVKGFTIINEMSLMSVEGSGMVGIPGVAERLFGALRSAGVSVVLISQASSEHSICLAISTSDSERGRMAVEMAFAIEIQKKLIERVHMTPGVSILAAVGDNMAQSPGIAGQFFSALGKSGINVRAIAQGSSERNISAVIDTEGAVKALRTVHSAFVVPHQMISLGLIGPGLIGSTFLRQLKDQRESLRKTRALDIRLRGLANSKKMFLAEDEIPLDQWQDLLLQKGEPFDLEKFVAHINSSFIPNGVVIESTASSALTPHYVSWLEKGLHLISPNKRANSGSYQSYLQIHQAARNSHRHFLYSTNVGAGLPVIQTLRDLYATGDQVVTIQGILSGTLAFIFNQFDGSRPFSEIVMMAKDKGFTEPDPREDLSGADVMRKIVILGREIGLKLEPEDVLVQGLVPEALLSISKENFLERMREMDAPMLEKLSHARSQKQILRFVGTIEASGRARVALEALPQEHAFARGTGTDNIVLFKTQRYFHQPLVIQGPGAGPEVTAAGVFADLLRLSQYR